MENYKEKFNKFKDDVGSEIRRRRLKLGLTGEDLGKMCGVSYHQILGIERGDRIPSFKTLYLIITKGLDISVDTFFRGFE